jgi:hypothetical protein
MRCDPAGRAQIMPNLQGQLLCGERADGVDQELLIDSPALGEVGEKRVLGHTPSSARIVFRRDAHGLTVRRVTKWTSAGVLSSIIIQGVVVEDHFKDCLLVIPLTVMSYPKKD